MISVIIPTYNREKTLKKSIMSVLNQTYKNIEVIIIDDNSTDNTLDIIKSIDDKRLKYIKHETNLGANKARNTGILHSIGDYIAFQDSDDEWMANKLEIQKNKLEESGADLVFCSFYRFNKNKCEIIPNKKIDNKRIKKDILYENFISTQTILGKRKCFDDEKFDELLPRFQDWDLMIRISRKYKIKFINQPLVNVYLQNDSISKDSDKAIKAMLIMMNKYHNIIKYNKKIFTSWNMMIIRYSENLFEKTKYFICAFRKAPYNIRIILCYMKSCIKLILYKYKRYQFKSLVK